MKEAIVIGGGLAGSEAAWQLAKRDIHVILYEMRHAQQKTFAHRTDQLAELVCSNSFRSDNHTNSAIGLLHEEMRRAESLIMKSADKNKVPAGGALAVDREAFSADVQKHLIDTGNVTIIREEIEQLPRDDTTPVILATGPLTSCSLAENIQTITGEEYLAFFDAIAPIIHKESIDFSVAWFQSRYDKVGPEGDGKDYINCPMDQQQYQAFISALLAADTTDFKEWEKNTPYFEGCLPIEVMAGRGEDTLRFGPMKPVGLLSPHTKEPSYAVVQLRQDNMLGTLYNMVGFQTKMKYGAQQEVLRMIPGLENAEFARLGGIHRNTFINSPMLLTPHLSLKAMPHIRVAGQITGVEGYVESAACGLLAGIFLAQELEGNTPTSPPAVTALGALLSHITENANAETFQPMNINFGLMPALEQRLPKAKRKEGYCERALQAQEDWRQHVA